MNTHKKPLSELTTIWQIYHEESMYYAKQEEKSDFEELRGRNDSRIYVHGEENGVLMLCVSTENPRLQNGLVKTIPGLRSLSGSVKQFPAALLDTVAAFIHARKRRVLNPEALERQRERGRQLAASYWLDKNASSET